MNATPSPFLECTKPAARSFALAAVISIAAHGALLAAAHWLRDTMVAPRVPPMVAVAVVSETALKPAPQPNARRFAARPVTTTERPKSTPKTQARPQPRPAIPEAHGIKPQNASPAMPIPDRVKTPPVPPKRPAFRAGKAEPRRAAPMAITIQPAVAAARPSTQQPSAPAAPATRGTAQAVAQAWEQAETTTAAGPQWALGRPNPVARRGNPAPDYPWISRQRGEHGRVIVTVAVSAEGHPEDVRIKRSSGYRRLDTAALAAIRKWRFVPARRSGRAVAGRIDVPITFRLTD